MSTILGVTFAMMIIGVGIHRLSISAPAERRRIIAVTVAGGALVCVLIRWVILPGIDPMMKLVPETTFFIAHLLSAGS